MINVDEISLDYNFTEMFLSITGISSAKLNYSALSKSGQRCFETQRILIAGYKVMRLFDFLHIIKLKPAVALAKV